SRMVRPERAKAFVSRKLGGSEMIENKFSSFSHLFAFALTERKPCGRINPGCWSFVALPWADGWLALQAVPISPNLGIGKFY
ncbi:MAG: hypothetical protein J6R91_01770, partial [Bacteroidaceae bacterium]|nr:hypothetical protein [Bacteroidaceae bacterium]